LRWDGLNKRILFAQVPLILDWIFVALVCITFLLTLHCPWSPSDLLLEQRLLVHILLEERQLLLRAASEQPQRPASLALSVTPFSSSTSANATKVLRLLNHQQQQQHQEDEGGGEGRLSPAAALACASNVRALSLGLVAEAAASALACATSHEAAGAALRSAAMLCASESGAAALAR
jgi:hypothetical protein